MAKNQVSLSGLQPKIEEVAIHFQQVNDSIALYYSLENPKANKLFLGMTEAELHQKKVQVLQENDYSQSLILLTALEASLRVDYIVRVQKKLKDPLSKDFFVLAKAKGKYVSLKEDILALWKEQGLKHKSLAGDINAAFKQRDWLAHGRYWVNKAGKNYDFHELYILCEDVINTFEFKGHL